MKKKIFSILLGTVLAASSVLLSACQSGGRENGGEGAVTVVEAPVLAYDTAEGSSLNSVIAVDELIVTLDGDVSASVASGPVTLTEGASSEADGVTTQTYTLTATGVGDYTIAFTAGEEEVESLTYTVVQAYPEDPDFNGLNGYGSLNNQTTEANVHDPSVLEADGKFYSFSTDNMGPAFGYQVRESDDLIHWSYVGVAIEGHDMTGAAYKAGTGALQEVYNVISRDANWGTNGSGTNSGETWTLWAPDVVEGSDGKYWLYGCWTADFGQGHSVIFLCKADEVTGPYTYDSIILYSYDGWPTNNSNPNAIDPQIYYVGDKMYMAYGSFNGGTWSIELDPATGLRADGLSGDELLPAGNVDAAERYGTRLVSGTVIEGPTVNYHENVAIYDGDPAEYSESAVTYEDRYYLMGSANDLTSTYNMRSFHATAAEDGTLTFTSTNSDLTLGDRVSGSFSWRLNADETPRRTVPFDFYAPGHNDMLTTSDGRNIIAYHNRIGFGSGAHYLFTSTYAFNSRGDLVMNPNRYAGEAVRKIVEEEITAVSEGKYYYAAVTNNLYTQSFNGGFAKDDMVLTADHKIQIGGQDAGTWVFYGDNYICIDITEGELDGVYYGVVMPAWLERSRSGGLTISCLSEDGQDTLYLNMAW